MAEAFIFFNPYQRWSPESNRNSNHTGLGLLASLRPSTVCPSVRAVNAFDFYNLSSSNFKIANQFSLVLK
jgi:hypothetical protein